MTAARNDEVKTAKVTNLFKLAEDVGAPIKTTEESSWLESGHFCIESVVEGKGFSIVRETEKKYSENIPQWQMYHLFVEGVDIPEKYIHIKLYKKIKALILRMSPGKQAEALEKEEIEEAIKSFFADE